MDAHSNLADFLTVASRLILIKSKALLPIFELSQEEEKEIEDLEKQLVLYRQYKEASKKIEKMYNTKKISFSRESFSGLKSFFYPPRYLTVLDLKKTFEKILEGIPIVEKLEEEIVREVVTLQEKISQLQMTLKKRIELTFFELTSGTQDKVDIIVSFLAVLELVKQRIISVEQNKTFADIKLRIKEEVVN